MNIDYIYMWNDDAVIDISTLCKKKKKVGVSNCVIGSRCVGCTNSESNIYRYSITGLYMF